MDIKALQAAFLKYFDTQSQRAFFAPGRVNLIGEHIDYNGGHVLPCAISNGTYGLVSLRSDQKISCVSLNFESDGCVTFDLADLSYQASDSWVSYIKGMIQYCQEKTGKTVSGFNLLIYGNIPNGAGLSSSASLELLIGMIVNQLFDLGLSHLDLALLGQKVENDYLGLNTGIMDQFAIGMSRADSAAYLKVSDMTYEFLPLQLGEVVLLIMNTNKQRKLTDSKYNKRRAECDQALADLQKECDITYLCQLRPDQFEALSHLIEDPTIRQRAKHVVYEDERTQQAKEALLASDWEAFGQLMNQSHQSLREDYDVTGLELDTLVEAAWEQEGVLGARMTGAGMGGCAIALVKKDCLDSVKDQIQAIYQAKVGYPASFYLAQSAPGICELTAINKED